MKKYLLAVSIVCFSAPTAQAIDFSSAFNSAKDYLTKNSGDLLEKGKNFLSENAGSIFEKGKEWLSGGAGMVKKRESVPGEIGYEITPGVQPKPDRPTVPGEIGYQVLGQVAVTKAEEGQQILVKEAVNLSNIKKLTPAEQEALKKEALTLAKRNRDALVNEANRLIKIDKDALRRKTYANYPVSRQQ